MCKNRQKEGDRERGVRGEKRKGEGNGGFVGFDFPLPLVVVSSPTGE